MNTRTKFFDEAIGLVLQKKHRGYILITREQVLYCFADLDNIPNLQPYLRELITKAAERIYNRRNRPNLLSFGHNEMIMIERLYEKIR